MSLSLDLLEEAFHKRCVEVGDSACRIFHGPGEGAGALADWTIDLFGRYVWLTSRGSVWSDRQIDQLEAFCSRHKILGAVGICRQKGGAPEPARILFGQVPGEAFSVREGIFQFLIRFLGVRHPGLFLDHEPLRRFLLDQGLKGEVLNTFSYTGSLSVAAGRSGAKVTSVDLSAPANAWARDNWTLNGLSSGNARFLKDDALEFMRKEAKRGRRYGCVILDPPTFARSGKRVFSTLKDLARLHELALEILTEGGLLVSAINSATVSESDYRTTVQDVFRKSKLKTRTVHRVELPRSFPTRSMDQKYLKGQCVFIHS